MQILISSEYLYKIEGRKMILNRDEQDLYEQLYIAKVNDEEWLERIKEGKCLDCKYRKHCLKYGAKMIEEEQ